MSVDMRQIVVRVDMAHQHVAVLGWLRNRLVAEMSSGSNIPYKSILGDDKCVSKEALAEVAASLGIMSETAAAGATSITSIEFDLDLSAITEEPADTAGGQDEPDGTDDASNE